MKIRSLAFASLFVLSVTSASAMTMTENFTNDPAADGWQVFGDTNLFQWNSGNQNLDVTWDSAQPNSYFYHPLGATLTSASNFMFGFDLRLSDIAGGTNPTKPQALQVAVGLLNFSEATNDGYYIGTGYNAPDLVELDYYPDTGYGDTVGTPMISSVNNFASGGLTDPFTLTLGATYHFTLIYTADNQTLHTTLTSNGVPVGPLKESKLTGTFGPFGDFNVDTFSINSYTDAGQDTNTYFFDGFPVVYAGSLLAHGTVGNLFFANPLPVTRVINAAPGSLQFSSTTNWIYALERTTNFQAWSTVSPMTPGVEGSLTLADTNPPPDKAFYRVRADRP